LSPLHSQRSIPLKVQLIALGWDPNIIIINVNKETAHTALICIILFYRMVKKPDQFQDSNSIILTLDYCNSNNIERRFTYKIAQHFIRRKKGVLNFTTVIDSLQLCNKTALRRSTPRYRHGKQTWVRIVMMLISTLTV